MPPQKPVGNGYYGYEEVPTNEINVAQPENSEENNILSTQNEEISENDENFSEYLWMENEEEFDKQVLQQLEEEELMEQCLEAMMEEERNNLVPDRMFINMQTSEVVSGNQDIMNLVNNLKSVDIAKSTLNPNAAEFVPDSKSMMRVFHNKNMD